MLLLNKKRRRRTNAWKANEYYKWLFSLFCAFQQHIMVYEIKSINGIFPVAQIPSVAGVNFIFSS